LAAVDLVEMPTKKQKLTTTALTELLLELEAWDPHTGKRSSVKYSPHRSSGIGVTRVKVVLEPPKSLFLVALR
jgi:hypothetical protein